MTRLPAQFRTSLGPTLQLKVLSGRNVCLSWHQEMMELNPIHHVLGECFACCVPGDKGQGGSDPHWLLLWCCTWSLGELIRAQAMPLSRMLASIWQSGQIHALGITQSRAVEKRFYSKLLLALGAVDRSSARDNTGHWAALTSTLFRSTWAEGKVLWKVKDSPFFDVVFLQTPGVLPGWFCCKPA